MGKSITSMRSIESIASIIFFKVIPLNPFLSKGGAKPGFRTPEKRARGILYEDRGLCWIPDRGPE